MLEYLDNIKEIFEDRMIQKKAKHLQSLGLKRTNQLLENGDQVALRKYIRKYFFMLIQKVTNYMDLVDQKSKQIDEIKQFYIDSLNKRRLDIELRKGLFELIINSEIQILEVILNSLIDILSKKQFYLRILEGTSQLEEARRFITLILKKFEMLKEDVINLYICLLQEAHMLCGDKFQVERELVFKFYKHVSMDWNHYYELIKSSDINMEKLVFLFKTEKIRKSSIFRECEAIFSESEKSRLIKSVLDATTNTEVPINVRRRLSFRNNLRTGVKRNILVVASLAIVSVGVLMFTFSQDIEKPRQRGVQKNTLNITVQEKPTPAVVPAPPTFKAVDLKNLNFKCPQYLRPEIVIEIGFKEKISAYNRVDVEFRKTFVKGTIDKPIKIIKEFDTYKVLVMGFNSENEAKKYVELHLQNSKYRWVRKYYTPDKIDGIIQAVAKENKIPFNRWLALNRCEAPSTVAISVTGARGPGVQPSTALDMVYRVGGITKSEYKRFIDPRKGEKKADYEHRIVVFLQSKGIDLTDYWVTSMLGCNYIAQQFEKYGKWDLSLSAYHCGPGNVKDKIPNIPQTRRYVRENLRLFNAYEAWEKQRTQPFETMHFAGEYGFIRNVEPNENIWTITKKLNAQLPDGYSTFTDSSIMKRENMYLLIDNELKPLPDSLKPGDVVVIIPERTKIATAQ